MEFTQFCSIYFQILELVRDLIYILGKKCLLDYTSSMRDINDIIIVLIHDEIQQIYKARSSLLYKNQKTEQIEDYLYNIMINAITLLKLLQLILIGYSVKENKNINDQPNIDHFIEDVEIKLKNGLLAEIEEKYIYTENIDTLRLFSSYISFYILSLLDNINLTKKTNEILLLYQKSSDWIFSHREANFPSLLDVIFCDNPNYINFIKTQIKSIWSTHDNRIDFCLFNKSINSDLHKI